MRSWHTHSNRPAFSSVTFHRAFPTSGNHRFEGFECTQWLYYAPCKISCTFLDPRIIIVHSRALYSAVLNHLINSGRLVRPAEGLLVCHFPEVRWVLSSEIPLTISSRISVANASCCEVSGGLPFCVSLPLSPGI